MKKFITILQAALLLLIIASVPASASGRDLTIIGSPAISGEVTVTLEKATAVKKTNPERYEYSFSGSIENNSDERNLLRQGEEAYTNITNGVM